MARLSILGRLNPNWGGGAERACVSCSAPVWVKPSRVGVAVNYCSRACALVGLSKRQQADANTRWSGGPEVRACSVCQKSFEASRREINRGAAKFCSLACAAEAKRRPMTEERRALRRINNSMTVLMHRTLHGTKAGRRWQDLAGYTARDLKAHLEDRFVEGMGWHNPGAWHIDHVRPKSLFKFTSAEDPAFRECWSLTNLQPLWAVDNLKKGPRHTAGQRE